MDVRRDPKGNGQWCDSGSGISTGKDVTENLFDSQKERGVAKNFGLHSPQQVLHGQKIQDGRQQAGRTVVDEEYVWNKYRYKSSISSYSCGSRIGRLPLLHLRSTLLPVQRNDFRNKDCTTCVFEDYTQVHHCDTPSLEGSRSPIHRRYLDRTREFGVSGESGAGGVDISNSVRMVDKYGEVRTSSSKTIHVSGMVVELSHNDSELGQREERKATIVTEAVEKESGTVAGGEDQGPGLTDRHSFSDEVTVLHGKSILSGTECSEGQRCPGNLLVRECQIESQTNYRDSMVDGQSKDKCSEGIGGSSNSDRDVDGCVPNRLGSMCKVDQPGGGKTGENDVRSLDEQVVVESKRTRSSSHGTRSINAREGISFKESMDDMVRQYDDGLQSEQVGVGVQFGEVNEEVAPISGESSISVEGVACERSTEFKGGQSIKAEQVGGLHVENNSVGSGIEELSSEDRMRSVRISDEPKTSGLLYSLPQGQSVPSTGRIHHSMGSVVSSVTTSPNTVDSAMSKEGSVRGGESSADSAVLVGTELEPDSFEDDSENDETGRIILNFNRRKADDQESGQIAAGSDGGISGGRRNDVGEELVRKIIENMGLSIYADWFFDSVAATTFRNYRRGFTLFVHLAREGGFDPLQIKDFQVALRVLLEVLNLAFQKRLKVSAVLVMKTAVVRLFEFLFGVKVGEIPIVEMAMKYYNSAYLPKKENLKLQWSVEKLFEYFMKLPEWKDLEFNRLMKCALVLCMAFSALRFTEILALNMNDTNPDTGLGVWKFWLHVKGHNYLEPVYLQMGDEIHLSPVAALLELRKRIRALDDSVSSFWCRLVGKSLMPLTYNELRGAAVDVLNAAGIQEKRPYHIKHAVLTFLDRNGISAQGIAAFARHKFGSMMAYKHYISQDNGKSSSKILENAVKKDRVHPN
jgi:integrase